MQFLAWLIFGLLMYVLIILIRLPTMKDKKAFRPDEYEVLSLMIMGPVGIAFVFFQAVHTTNTLLERKKRNVRNSEKNQG
jgi:hypothetical protein